METTLERPTSERPARSTAVTRPVVTKIVAKFQTTVPPEIREIYGLQEGDLIEWKFDRENSRLVLLPKRAHLLTPQVEQEMDALKARRAKKRIPTPV